MKRLFIFVVVGLLLGGTALFADQSVLIDFTKLGADQTWGRTRLPLKTGRRWSITAASRERLSPTKRRRR